jgi:heme-degrading monooxygenase HmoA
VSSKSTGGSSAGGSSPSHEGRGNRREGISRIWHGWTAPQNAAAYERLLKEEIFVGIARRRITGYRGIELLRREHEGTIEFVTIMWFDSLEAAKSFAGADYEVAVVPPKARELLLRFDQRSAHYEVIQPR